MELTQEQKLYTEIVQKAWEDENFKKALATNPIGTIEQFTGKKLNLTKDQTIIVEDQTEESIVYFNIPRRINHEDLELSENQLEAISGGIGDDGIAGTLKGIIRDANQWFSSLF